MNNAAQENTHEEHLMFYEIIWQYMLEVFNFFKYIFYDVFRGIDP